MAARLGESLNHILNGLEDLGLDEIPAELEHDLRLAMNLPSAASFSDDEVSEELLSPLLGMSPTNARVLQIGGGILTLETAELGSLDLDDDDEGENSPATKIFIAYGSQS